MKADLRRDRDYQRSMESNGGFVGEEEAVAVVNSLNLLAYGECSAYTKVGVKQIFDVAITAALTNKHRTGDLKGKKCMLL